MTRLALAALLCLAAVLPLSAERGFKDWLKDLEARIRRTESRRNSQIAAVASVRGAKQDDAAKLYWKGRRGNRSVTAEELDAFKGAVRLAKDGKTAEAKAALEAFVAKYPGGALEEDAKQTLALLPAEAASDAPAAAATAAPAPEAQPEAK